jgi:RNA polymerase sigma-70 factor (ECF subfamily)
MTKTKPELEPLLPRVAAGDPDAFRECMDRYKSLIWWLARKHIGINAEDAVQEVFLALWKNAARFDAAKASEPTFVGMVARRRLIDMHRSRNRRPETEPIEDLQLEGATARSIEASAEASLAQRAINDLSDKEREVLKLSTYLGLTHTEIAGHLNMPLGTVKTYVRRALMRVRAELQDGPSEGSARRGGAQ